MHATEFLTQSELKSVPPIVVLFGGERFLKQQVQQLFLQTVYGPEADAHELASFLEGREAEWRSVADELKTISMWSGKRCVIINAADDFVSANRPQLEKYADNPAKSSLLILDVKSWPKSTKLAKKVQKTGEAIECGELKGAQLQGWVVSHAAHKYEKTISRQAGQLLIDLAGTSVGLLDQELDKLTSYVGQNKKITDEDVRALVGGWRLETTWNMINGVRDGQLDMALVELNKLMTAGEAPQKLLGGISFVYRKIVKAVRISAKTRQLGPALKQAGIFPRDVGPTETYLRKLGRERAERIPELLAKVDLGMKGESSLPPRLLIEKLLVELSP
ncbi:DNA polymerase III subunit delta [Rubinisphaera sp.]|uniref:DNA polymerase III subunit delta n=1 Tax=Rubinisphaera sp. TaxID=2024857 RepID=UPI000C10BDA7|nr:DNA polymerase III subunit delta [Rubinisphaera sp.]MBV10063.1 DNA polymerase III subunit delta [Rubinisphaera sp.]HCS53780.1 DNA polymerase III subunit delta [Planctomycetaceae bacterium]